MIKTQFIKNLDMLSDEGKQVLKLSYGLKDSKERILDKIGVSLV